MMGTHWMGLAKSGPGRENPGGMTDYILPRLLAENPVVATGLGAFCAAGVRVEEVWKRTMAGSSPATWRRVEGHRVPVCAAPEVEGRRPELRAARGADRVVLMALAAAQQAWDEAGLKIAPPPPSRAAVLVGTSRGPVGKWAEAREQVERGRLHPSLAAAGTIASLSGTLSVALGIQGPAWTVAATCASSAHALALAAQQILLGAADVVLVGGAEASLDPLIIEQLRTARVLGNHEDPARACRPFAADRNGTVLGEGAAFLVLESADSANRRGARAQARLAGWGLSSEACQRTGITADADGLARAMTEALGLAGLDAAQIGYVNVHGTGTPLNDLCEARAMRRVFPQGVPCSSTKPVTGHCMGAGAALEAVLAILALQRQVLPPTAGAYPVDPDCAVDLIQAAPRPARVQAVMSNSAGFWGNCASLIFCGS